MSLRKIWKTPFRFTCTNTLKPSLVHVARLLFNEAERMRLYGLRDIPIAVNLETNGSCTRYCDYCPRPRNNSRLLEEEIFMSAVDQLADWGFRGRFSPHSFNEPLTDRRLSSLIR